MKSKLALQVLTFVVLPVAATAGLAEWWHGQSWEFVQSVGGISAGVPTRDSSGDVSLPINCDVSGSSTITHKPTTMNSALAVKKVRARVKDRTITLSLFTAVYASSFPSALCGHANIGDLPPGSYAVVYRGADKSPHQLGSVVVP